MTATPRPSLRISLPPASLLSPDEMATLLQQAIQAILDRRSSGDLGSRRSLAAGTASNECDDDPDCKFIEKLPNGWLMYLCGGAEVFYPQ